LSENALGTSEKAHRQELIELRGYGPEDSIGKPAEERPPDPSASSN
jgi:hypothetical protein